MRRLLLLALLASACADSSEPGPEPTGALRFFHAAADLGPVTVSAGNEVVAQSVPYGTLTGLTEVAAGTRVFQARAGSSVVATQTLSVAPTGSTTIVLARTGASLQLEVAADTGQKQADRGNLRLISVPEVPRQPGDSSAHAKAGLLDVYVTAPAAPLAGVSPRLSMDTGYPTYSTYLYYAPGSWQVRFTQAGTKTVVADAGTIVFAPGDALAVVIRRAANGSWITAVELID